MLVKLFCSLHVTDWYEIMSLKTLKSVFSCKQKQTKVCVLQIQPSPLAQVAKRERGLFSQVNKYGD